jgi:hypothetical protein
VALAPGSYTVVLSDAAGAAGAGGTGLVEIYDADGTTDRLVNLSSRAFVDAAANVGVVGVVVRGEKAARYLVRAVGPGLAGFGVSGAVGDPVLSVLTTLNQKLATNDDWGTATNAAEVAAVAGQIGAFLLATGSKDAALLVTLAPGAYTVLVSPATGVGGVALIEVFEVP